MLMPIIELKVRNLKTGDIMVAEIPSIDDTLAWLEARPHCIDVLGVVTEELPDEIHEAMRNAMRPLDEEEKELDQALQDARMAEMEKVIAAEKQRSQERLDEHIEAQKSADPARPMVLHFELGEGLTKSDPYDDRDIPDEVRTAVDAWLTERNGWVSKKGLEVHSADISAWPQEIPDGWEGRIQPGGHFTPGLKQDSSSDA